MSFFRVPKGIFFGVLFLVLVLDQFTKELILRHIGLHEMIPVIPGFFQIVHVHNRGAAFGILRHLPEAITTPLFLTIGALALILLFFLLRKVSPQDRTVFVALGGIAGGAVGNLLDRLRHGYVVDFLDFYLRQYHWPAFNVADSAISVGITYLVVRSLLGKDPFLSPSN